MLLFAVLTILESIQLTALAAWVLSFVPPPAPLAHIVLPEWQYLLKPEWETIVFRVFVFACLGFMAALLWRWGRRVDDAAFMSRLRLFVAAEAILTVLLLAALFKITVYSARPACAQGACILVAVLLAANKILAPQLKGILTAGGQFLDRQQNRLPLRRLADIAMVLGIAAIVYIPNPQAVVARMFVGEQFHHNDSFIMGPGWAYLNGCLPDVDTISQYGIGFVTVISLLAKWTGGFTYVNVLMVMVGCTIVYYWAWYWLLRRWLGGPALCAAVVFLGIKWQMFHTSAYPLVFTYGSQTPLRFLYDAGYFILLWRFLNNGRVVFAYAAAAMTGFGIYYLTSEGVYATASLYAFLLVTALAPSLRQTYPLRLTHRLACAAVPPLVFLLLTGLTVGTQIFGHSFWLNMGEFIGYFTSGFGMEPMSKTLVERNFLQSLMGFVIPIVYLITVLITGAWAFLGKASRRDLFALILCLYGLGTFHYYVARSVATSYDAVSLPFVFVLGYWARLFLAAMPAQRAWYTAWALAAAAAYALATNHLFMSYPNMLNLSHNPMTDPRVAAPLDSGKPYFNHLFRDYPDALKLPANSLGSSDEELVSERDFAGDDDLVAYYRQMSDFSADAQLIDELTPGDEGVPLISSFEVPLLMQAHRRPYFYYFPLIISRPMAMRMFTATSIYTTDQMKRVLDKLEHDKPPYIFMERIFLNRQVPQAYLFQFPALMILLDYVQAHYTADRTGQYLVAMKRNDT